MDFFTFNLEKFRLRLAFHFGIEYYLYIFFILLLRIAILLRLWEDTRIDEHSKWCL